MSASFTPPPHSPQHGHPSGGPRRPPSSIPTSQGLPWVTWVIGGAACAIAASAIYLVLSSKDETTEETLTEDIGLLPEPSESKQPLVADPLNVSAMLLDAAERSRIWNDHAALTAVEVIIEDGKPTWPLRVEFGPTVGAVMPGAPILPDQLDVNFDGKNATTEVSTATKKRSALPEPNCPLEVAYRTVRDMGVSLTGKTGVLLGHSERHGRTVWLFSLPDGSVTSIDADSCTVLRR